MTPKDAELLILNKGSLEEVWVRHSFKVRDAALLIGKSIGRGIDFPFLEASALLHDIGRFKTHGLWHTWEGWLFLDSLGERELARATITHWLKGRTLRRVLRTSPGIDKARILEIFEKVKPRPLTVVDMIISVADAMVSHDKVVSFTERFKDLEERYGAHPWLKDSERLARCQAKRLSGLAGKDIPGFVLEELGS